MASELRDGLKVAFVLIAVLSTGSGENDMDWTFCGLWLHDLGSPQLDVNISPGCSNVSVSANRTTLSIHGQVTAQCRRFNGIQLDHYGLGHEKASNFCLYWEPALDRLILQVKQQNFSLCRSAHPEGSCCTDLSRSSIGPEVVHGIKKAMIRTDVISLKTFSGYTFKGERVPCKTLRGDTSLQSNHLSSLEHRAEQFIPVSFNIDLEDSRPYDLSSPISRGEYEEPTITVHLPPALKLAMRTTTKVAVTFHTNTTFFQDGHKETKILGEVVDITVENEIIADLSEPIRISFYHDAIQEEHSRKCVAWDSRKNPVHVKWLAEGCVTSQRGVEHTECFCNHLTYFSVLVELQPRPVRHLMALTVITSLGCAASFISCVALIVFLCTKSRQSKEQSVPIHLGLALSLAVLHLLFFLTGVLANLGGEALCAWVGAGMHYSLLSSFTWMGIEIFHTFWLVYVVFTPSPKPYIWNLLGFGLPLIPVIILVAVGDVYGLREVFSADDLSNPYQMCWMKDSTKALLAHYVTNITSVLLLVSSGIVMLILVYRKIRIRDEWKQTQVAFLSIWGLSCLFGTFWGLTFFEFMSDLVLFFSCFLTSFQGFFIALRFYMLEWMRKRAASTLCSNSTGSTRQHMLQEKS